MANDSLVKWWLGIGKYEPPPHYNCGGVFQTDPKLISKPIAWDQGINYGQDDVVKVREVKLTHNLNAPSVGEYKFTLPPIEFDTPKFVKAGTIKISNQLLQGAEDKALKELMKNIEFGMKYSVAPARKNGKSSVAADLQKLSDQLSGPVKYEPQTFVVHPNIAAEIAAAEDRRFLMGDYGQQVDNRTEVERIEDNLKAAKNRQKAEKKIEATNAARTKAAKARRKLALKTLEDVAKNSKDDGERVAAAEALLHNNY